MAARVTLVALAALLAVGCPAPAMRSDAALPDAVSFAPANAQSLCRDLMAARWQALARCLGWSSELTSALTAMDVCAGTSELQRAFDDGVVTLDQPTYDTCVLQWANASCTRPLFVSWFDGVDVEAITTLCPGALRGQRFRGQACGRSYECPASDYCQRMPASACRGLCEASAVAGLACTDGRCAIGVSCFADGICRAPVTEATSCTRSMDCVDLGEHADWFCAAETGRCSAPREAGAPCHGERECADELICSSPGTCSAPLPAGQPCRPGFDSDAGDCADDLWCSGGSVDPTTHLTTALGACAARPSLGGSCDVAPCASGSQCVAGQCAAPGQLGDACALDGGSVLGVDDPSCASGLTCASGHCARRRFVGERCDDGASACFASTCQGPLCVAVPITGPPCSAGACPSGACDGDGLCMGDITMCASP